ncbi:hypothetical protein EZ428_18365 [Pedobacter frigiditerrae]|uniref:Polysaccharide lyase n=1 Tax=Pedobacter frigiditerrae TaxID=2530452 RepID=A0A4R0MRD9_9SPHI|nr:heparin lyase I family protein [Pedobacter frigiditerrae]TCC88604.1 hypothetical protein EZ428_18365 [Pedobacter frigiditerrae]
MKKSILTKILVLSLAIAGVLGTYSCHKDTENQVNAEGQQVTKLAPDMVLAANATYLNTSSHQETGFEDNSAEPFNLQESIYSPSYIHTMIPSIKYNNGGDYVQKFYWTQGVWDAGSKDCSADRFRKGVEVRSDLNFKKDGWMGFAYMIPTDFPSDRSTIIAQGFNEGSSGGCARSWVWHLTWSNGTLTLTCRKSCGVETYTHVVATNITKGVWKPVVVQWRASNTNHGKVVVWHGQAVYDRSTPQVSRSNINLGYGTWSSDNLTSFITLKYGIYAYDCCDHVGSNDTEVVYFDNMSQWVDDAATNNGFDKVDPTQ